MARFASAIAVVLLCSVIVSEQTAAGSENWCRAVFFTDFDGRFKFAVVRAKIGAKVNFRGDSHPNCPEETDCFWKSYLVAGVRLA